MKYFWYIKIWWKVGNIIMSKINSELIYNKKYLKTEKRLNTKESFKCLHIRVIFFDSYFCYPEVFLGTFIHNFFWRSIIKFGSGGFGSSSWNIRKFHFLKCKEFFQSFCFPKRSFLGVDFFYFSSLVWNEQVPFLEI